MSLFDISSWFTGQDETARGQAADSALATLNNTDYAPGGTIYNSIASTQGTDAANAAYVTVGNDLANDEADTASYNSQVAGAFVDGARQGLANVTAFIKNPFLGIPIAWWFIAGIVLFFYIGGGGYIKGILKRKNTP